MKTYVFVASTVAAVSLVWALYPSAPIGVDPLVSGSIRHELPIQAYRISSIDGKNACTAQRGAPVSNRSRMFTAPADCNAVWPGLASVKNWTENEDGTVVLSSASGEAVLTVTEGNHAGYEAMEPDDAEITLRAIR